MRKIFLFFLFCTLLVTLVIMLRIPLLEWGVHRYLSSKNFHNISLELRSCSLDRLEIKTFSADFNPNQQHYAVSIYQVSLQYTLAGLAAQRLDRLSIQRAAITLPPASASHTKKTTVDPSAIKDVIESLQEVTIPIEEVAIKQLFFNGTSTAHLKDNPITLQLHRADKELHLNLLFALTDQDTIELSLQRSQDRLLSAIVRHTKKEHHVQTLHLTAEATQLTAQATLSIEELSKYILVDQLQGFVGNIKAAFTLLIENPLSLQLQIQADGLQHLKYSASDLNLDMQATLDSDKRVTISNASRLQIDGFKSSKIQIQHLDLPIGSTLTPAGRGIKVNFSSPPAWQVVNLEVGGTNIKDIQFLPLQEVLITKDTTSLSPQLAPITFQEVNIAGWRVPQFTITPVSKEPITLQKASKAIKITSPSWQTNAFTLKKDKLQLSCESVYAELNHTAITDTLETSLFLRTPAFVLSSSKMALPVKEVTGKVRLTDQGLKATLQMLPSNNPGRIHLTVDHGLNSGKGVAKMTTKDPILFSQSQGIASLVEGIPLPFTVTSGKLNTETTAFWNKKQPVRAHVSIQVTDSSGFLKGIPFSGLQIDQTMDVLPELRSHKTGKLEIAQINGAIPVTNVQGIFNISPSSQDKRPHVAVQQLGADIMQGSIKTDPFVYMPGMDQQAVTIRADGIDLAEVVGLLKVKGLQVDGKINGYLPLTIHKKEVTLDNGEVYGGSQGGTIRFRPQGIPTEQSQFTAYALKALEEFHFTILKAPVKYLPDGTLLVDIQLHGVSPPLSTTRPVHLNIHTEQNLLSLLKSLRYNKALTKDLDKHLQNRL